MRRVAIYCRVSTLEQRPEIQRDALRAYAQNRGLEIAGEYIDHGVSGAKDRRPALDAMMADARRRRFDAVACVKLDRLARSVHHLTSLGRELEALGVDLVVLDQAIDTSTPAGRLLFNVLGSIAEFERDLARERTAAGMQAAKRRGKHVGRPAAKVDRRRLLTGMESGASVSQLARSLGVSRATARRLVSQAVAERALVAGMKSAVNTGVATPR